MDALVGGIQASGASLDTMDQAINEKDIMTLFNDLPSKSMIAYKIKWNDYKPLFNFILGYNNEGNQLPTGASSLK